MILNKFQKWSTSQRKISLQLTTLERVWEHLGHLTTMFGTRFGPSVVSLAPCVAAPVTCVAAPVTCVAAPVTCHPILPICSMGSVSALGLHVGIFTETNSLFPFLFSYVLSRSSLWIYYLIEGSGLRWLWKEYRTPSTCWWLCLIIHWKMYEEGQGLTCDL